VFPYHSLVVITVLIFVDNPSQFSSDQNCADICGWSLNILL